MAGERTNDSVGWMLHTIAEELGPWISERDGWPPDTPASRRIDPQVQLKVIVDEWFRVFRDHLSAATKNHVFELRDIRNRWAHHEPFTADDIWRALDTGERLLRAIGAGEAAERLKAARRVPVSVVTGGGERAPTPPVATPPPRTAPLSVERSVDEIDPVVVDAARRAAQKLVDRAGGVQASRSIPVDYMDAIADLFEAWARHHGRPEPEGEIWFGPKPGLWQALQGVVPIDDPKRLDALRKAVLIHK